MRVVICMSSYAGWFCIWLIMPSTSLLYQQFSPETIFSPVCPFSIFVPHLPKGAWEARASDKPPFLGGAQRPEGQQLAVTPWGGPSHHILSPACVPKGGRQGSEKPGTCDGSKVLSEPLAIENCVLLWVKPSHLRLSELPFGGALWAAAKIMVIAA